MFRLLLIFFIAIAVSQCSNTGYRRSFVPVESSKEKDQQIQWEIQFLSSEKVYRKATERNNQPENMENFLPPLTYIELSIKNESDTSLFLRKPQLTLSGLSEYKALNMEEMKEEYPSPGYTFIKSDLSRPKPQKKASWKKSKASVQKSEENEIPPGERGTILLPFSHLSPRETKLTATLFIAVNTEEKEFKKDYFYREERKDHKDLIQD